ncbi:hypothetical protein [Lentilactobacillus buchneri]
MNTKNKLKATLLIAAGALLLGISTTQPTSASATASSTTSTTKSTSTRYDAQIITPKSLASGYQIYSNVPGVKNTTGTPTTTTDSSKYNNQYVRVM